MWSNSLTRRMAVAVTVAALAFGASPAAYAQGCALCYTTAAAASAAGKQALNLGIFALLIPALTLFAGVMFLLYRRAVSTT